MRKSWLFIPILLLSVFSCSNNDPQPQPDPDPPEPTPTDTVEVTWNLDNGTTPIKETYKIGETPSYKYEIVYKEGHSEEYGYLFKSWDKPLAPLTVDTTYTAIYDTEESCVMSSVILMTLQKKNVDHCEFHYTGHLKEVDWGDGVRNQLNTHTYPALESQTYLVKIFGNITSISFADEKEVYGKANLAIRSITLASTITDLPDNAFKGCTYANSVFVSKNVKHVGISAFDNLRDVSNDVCLIYTQTGISTTDWSDNWNPDNYRVVENINRMGLAEDESNKNNYFGYLIQQQEQEEYLAICSYYDKNGYDLLTSITIPDKIDGMHVNSIIYSPFSLFTKLDQFDIKATHLYYIGEEGLKLGKMSTLDLPKSLTTIGKRAFYNCSDLETLNLNDNNSLTTIGEEAFYMSTKISNEIKIPSTVDCIGPNAFNFCHNVKITNLENTKIKKIHDGTFYQCLGIKSIGLPITLTGIYENAFGRCTNLESVDASRYTSVENIPECCNAFNEAKTNATVICNEAFGDNKEAMKAFIANGWPDSFTYQIKVNL
ncbi:MAG: leucine-rich repeat domain-containing protein [Bacilli bacterium]|nr:leucine-rich repeat domain-containing protein [Bacilli bacterium]